MNFTEREKANFIMITELKFLLSILTIDLRIYIIDGTT